MPNLCVLVAPLCLQSKKFWMGLADGGCEYGNLLNSNKYPFLMGVSLTTPVREALGIKAGVGCGACVRITCPSTSYYCKPGNPSVVATILDICPDGICAHKQADLYTSAWNVLAQDSNPADVIVERVTCPPPTENVHLYVTHRTGTYLKVSTACIRHGGLGDLQTFGCLVASLLRYMRATLHPLTVRAAIHGACKEMLLSCTVSVCVLTLLHSVPLPLPRSTSRTLVALAC